MEHFLLQTSILDRLCGSLCDAVTEAENSQQMVEALEAGNLFLLPLDNQREWFRYHHLFADFLYQELRRRHPDDVADLHRRAAHWHLAHDLPDQAFAHTVRAEDGDIMQEIFERHFIPKLLRGEIRTLQLWLESMPDAWHTRYPIIGLARAATLMFSGQFEAATHFLDEIEHQTLVGRKDRRWQLARVTALRCFMACRRNELTRAEALADDALKDLRKEDVSLRLDIFGALGDTYRKGGHWQKAQASYLNVLDFSHAPTFHIQSVHVYGALADLEMRQGHLHNADGYWREALATIQTHKTWGEGGYPLPLIGWVYIRLGELLYEWNNLPTAWDHLSRGLEHAEMGGDVRAMIAGYLIGGRFKLTQGDLEAAESYLEQARPLVERAQFSHWFSRFERFQLEVWLAGDRLRAAVNWSDKMLDDDTITQRPESEIAQLAMARVLIVKGNTESISRALTLLDRLLVTSSEEGRTHITIEALALRALADWERGDTPATFTSLERALRLAEPEGHIRLFADLGLPMARLLQEALVRELMPEYAGELLAAFQETAQTKLPEPLTNREREILGLIAAGLTNREIGAVLVISPQTVKKHAGSIYDKLGVNNRTQAAARARELQLRD
jgi:LuxR family maltose regulon positive regulatory protein